MLSIKTKQKIRFRKNFLENVCRINMENFNQKAQSSHSNESTFFLVFICAFIKYLLRAEHVLDFAPVLGAAEMRKTDSL